MNHTESLTPLYYNRDKLVKSPQVLYRTNFGEDRYYYSISEKGEIVQLPSVTTILNSVMPVSDYLIKWIAEWGEKRANEIKNQKADYGTLMHIIFSQFLVNRTFDLSTLPAIVETFKVSNQISYRTDYWIDDLEKDIRAFEVFASIHDIKPIAISLMLGSEKLGYAGEIDLVVEMRIGTGVNGNILKNDIKIGPGGEILTDKTMYIYAIIDFKSGKHGFYPVHEAQLHMYKNLWSDRYPHIPIDALYNWAPKDWTSEPGYHLKEQSESVEAGLISNYVTIFKTKNRESGLPRYHPNQEGILKLGHVNGNFKLETFADRIRRMHKIEYPEVSEILKPVLDEQANYNSQEVYKDPTDLPVKTKSSKTVKAERINLDDEPELNKQVKYNVPERVAKVLNTESHTDIVNNIQNIFNQ